MRRSWALVDLEAVLRVQEIAIQSAVWTKQSGSCKGSWHTASETAMYETKRIAELTDRLRGELVRVIENQNKPARGARQSLQGGSSSVLDWVDIQWASVVL